MADLSVPPSAAAAAWPQPPNPNDVLLPESEPEPDSMPEASESGSETSFQAATSDSSPPPAIAPPPAISPPPASEAQTLIHLSFNQDHGCFAAGTDRGFRIFNCDPFREIFRRDLDSGGIGVVEMLFRCNILALSGGGTHPHYPPNKVMIWDDHQSRCIGELSFRSEVRAVRLRRDRIIVVLDHKIFVYNFADLKLVHQIETVPNPKGLCAVSQQQGSLVLVCPGVQKGQVRVEHYGARRTKFIMAHDSRIACFALSQDGRLIATASTKGTLVRIFSALDGVLLQEVSCQSILLQNGQWHNSACMKVLRTSLLLAIRRILSLYWEWTEASTDANLMQPREPR